MISVALMVVESTVPSTKTCSPLVTALLAAERVPFSYFVEDCSSTVTSWPADVVRVKLDSATFPTAPVDPPAAGPDRALEPCPPDPKCPGRLLAAMGCAAPTEADAPRPTNKP